MRYLVIALILAGCGKKDQASDPDDTADAPDGPRIRFIPHVVDDEAVGVRHPVLVDLQGTGRPDIVVSTSAPPDGQDVRAGSVVRYRWTGGDLAGFAAEELVPASVGIRHPNRPTFHDVDGDGDLDLIVPGGSVYCAHPDVDPCGSLTWFENTGVNWIPHAIVSESPAVFTGVTLTDIDGDGAPDLIAAGEVITPAGPAVATTWFRGTGQGFETTPRAIGPGGGPFPIVYDVDGDGDYDVVVGERVTANTFVWFERVAGPTADTPGGTWTRHVIDDSRGPGWFAAMVPDLYGDGITRMVATNHTNTAREQNPDPWESVVAVYDLPTSAGQAWTGTDISEGIESIQDLPIIRMEAPGTLDWGDIDGDGDIDLIVAGDGDPTIYLLEQTEPGTFVTRILRGGVGRNGVAAGDINGDGQIELVVTGQVDNAIYVIEVEVED